MQTYRFGVSSNGIGDAVSGLYVAAGLANALPPLVSKVRYASKHRAWLFRCAHPGVELVDWKDESDAGSTPDVYAGVREQLRVGAPRREWFRAKLLGQMFDIPRFELAAPLVDRKIKMPATLGRYVVLAPFASRVGREWPMSHWRRLILLLNREDVRCVVIAAGYQKSRLHEEFGMAHTLRFDGQTPQFITDLMLGAMCFVGNDSGMVHLSALLKVPTVCVHAHIDPKGAFEPASVLSMCPDQDEMSCTFCRFQGPLGYDHLTCDPGCSALATVSSERVALGVLQQIGKIQ